MFMTLYFMYTGEQSKTRQLPMGAATAHGMGLLTEMYVIYMENTNGLCVRGCKTQTFVNNIYMDCRRNSL